MANTIQLMINECILIVGNPILDHPFINAAAGRFLIARNVWLRL